ncbi:hypothetical protein [Phenylobacterium soli]|uniref:Uncharacterized protein n=1 Tax=Phenylobacterium soli TaxID=2170551 RepID=A0A328AJ22_9CAUL|nr:hypothetical protein [Phenylobacterium soli]RAK54943.1 hypothetical protein DJ017_10585 [Phenylobacterium soli]
MTYRRLLAGSAVALGLTFAASAAFAASKADSWFTCQTWTPAKAAPPTTHCVTWTKSAAARLRAADCDPAKMSLQAMRERCAELSTSAQSGATSPNS